jgi:Fe-S-cluster-containing dehydrogenase component
VANEVTETPQDDQSTILSRRDFMTLLVGGGASFVMAATLAQPLDNLLTPAIRETIGSGYHGAGDSPYRWGMVIDLSKCVGCDYCVYACQAINDTTEELRWNIRVTDETPTGNIFHVTRPCLHCNNAPCVDVCPVTATYHRADGLVVMDYDKCIGCRYCQTACPYGARTFNWTARDEDENNPVVPDFGRPEVPTRARGVVEKCTFCIHRIDAGLENGLMPGVDEEATPACVNICPVTARFFGNLKDPNSTVSRIIAETPTLRLREDLGTDPNVYYIPAEGMVSL